jgi:hypothetical protein
MAAHYTLGIGPRGYACLEINVNSFADVRDESRPPIIQPDADKFISYYIAWRLPENSTVIEPSKDGAEANR